MEENDKIEHPGSGSKPGKLAAALKHGAFSPSIPLSERGQALITNGISYLMSIPGVRDEYIPLIQRIERIWVILLKLDEYEDKAPEKMEYAHFKYKCCYENSLQRAFSLLFNLTGKKKDMGLRDVMLEMRQEENKDEV